MKFLINSRSFERTADAPTGLLAATMTFGRPSLVYKLIFNTTIGGGTVGTSRVFFTLGQTGDTFSQLAENSIITSHGFYNDDAATTVVLPQSTIIDFEDNPLEVDDGSPINAYVFGAPGSNVYAVVSFTAFYTLAASRSAPRPIMRPISPVDR